MKAKKEQNRHNNYQLPAMKEQLTTVEKQKKKTEKI